MKVLVIDDNTEFRTLAKHMLEQLGHESCEASNGLKGLPIALSWKPDVILIDLLMPIQDGFITCRKLRQAGYRGHIIVISALANTWADLRNKVPEANSFLMKPIAFDALEEALEIQPNTRKRKITIESLRI